MTAIGYSKRTHSGKSPALQLSRLTVILLLSTSVFITGCQSIASVAKGGPQASAEELYRDAKRSLRNGNFVEAVETFETLGALYPFGNFTQQAQLDVAYAYFKQDEYNNAISTADRFIKLYPRSNSIDYAYFIKGLANYTRGSSPLERIFPRDLAKVNQSWLRSSFADFDTLVTRFPASIYVPDALERMSYLQDSMARHELETAQYYFGRGAMVATVNRIKFMLEHYEESRHTGNGLALMARAYQTLGHEDLKRDTLRVLALNNPEHPALENFDELKISE